MRIAVLADVHANLPALQAALNDAASLGCETIWCAGDLVGRGPHPNEVVKEIRALDVPVVQGNWDEAVGMDRAQPGVIWATPETESDGIASLTWTAARIDEDHRTWLRQLPANLRFTADERSVLLFHGSPLRQNEYLWSDRPSRTLARVAADESDDLFCFGHTHETYHRLVGASHFVNAGSVGCGSPSDGRAQYAVIDLNGDDVQVNFRAIAYDRSLVERDLQAAGLSLDLLRIPPVPHPLFDPGLETAVGA
jgi:putative phosphoesterase